MRILALSGSLRRASTNTVFLRAATRLAPPGVEIVLYEGLGDLPHYNPDLEDAGLPDVVAFRNAIQTADGVLISSPEYAHGVPGSFKNALDWLVGGVEFNRKPVALFNASPRATRAQESLAETLTVMSGRIVAAASVALPLFGKNLDETAIATDPELSQTIAAALRAFAQAIDQFRAADE